MYVDRTPPIFSALTRDRCPLQRLIHAILTQWPLDTLHMISVFSLREKTLIIWRVLIVWFVVLLSWRSYYVISAFISLTIITFSLLYKIGRCRSWNWLIKHVHLMLLNCPCERIKSLNIFITPFGQYTSLFTALKSVCLTEYILENIIHIAFITRDFHLNPATCFSYVNF